MKKRLLLPLLSLLALTSSFGANTVETVTQVTSAVTLSGDKDLHITSTTPFTVTGSINITNTENAVVIFDNIRPSKAIAQLGFININGVAAKDTVNCMLKIYKHGSILLPHGSSFHPLTLYSGVNMTGTAYSNFEVRTPYNLTSESLDNHVRSFKLKRGYMVCLSTSPDGYGYNRVFVADNADRVVNIVQNEFYDRVSFVKVFQWNDTDKKGYAGKDSKSNEILNTTWCYNWDAGNNIWKDREYVTVHENTTWPSVSTVGNNGTSANSFGECEPDNENADIPPVTVDEVLVRWPELMATGKRLGSPSALKQAGLDQCLDSIDARGWRCDFVVVHSYWYQEASAWQSTLAKIHNTSKRAIWINEMNYGANWTGWPGDSTTASSANYKIQYNHMKPILDVLDELPYVERYSYYNWVQDCRKIYNTSDSTLKDKNYLTPIGEFYAADNTDMAYVPDYEFVPTTPRFYPASNFKMSYKASTGECRLSWVEKNGEFCDTVIVERKEGTGDYHAIAVMPRPGTVASKTYSYIDTLTEMGNYAYRIHTKNCNGVDYYSGEVYNIINGAEGSGDIQYGEVSVNNTSNCINNFNDGFDDMPSVVFGGVTNNNPNLAPVERVLSVDKNASGKYASFKSNLFPWTLSGYQTFYSTKNNTESTHYIVAKTGNGTIGSLTYESGYVHNALKLDSAVLVGNDTVYCPFVTPFDDGVIPVVFATPRYTTSYYPYMWRVWNVTNKGFNIILQRQAGLSATYAGWPKQYVAYFAISQGQSADGKGKLFTVGNTDIKFTSKVVMRTLGFNKKIIDPMIMGQLQTLNRKCAGILRFRSTPVTDSTTTIRLQLDSTDVSNNDISYLNPLTENIGWITISTDTTKTGIDDVKGNVKSTIVITPSVATDAVLVKDEGAYRAYVYNLNGLKVMENEMCEGQVTLTVSELPKGVYIIRTDKNNVSRFIKR